MTRAEAPYTDVSSLLAQHSRQFPTRVFIESIHQGTRITFAEACRVCDRLAHFLKARGLRANDRVAVLSENSLEAILIFYGVLRFGAAVNPINVEESSYNIRQILEDVRPKLVLVHRDFAAERPDVVRDAPGECIPFGDWGAAGPAACELFGMLRAVPDAPIGPPVGGADDMGVVVFTSGTTERPKGVLISHAGYSAMVQEVAERFEIGPDDRVLEYRAYSWESPQLLAIGPALHRGCTLVLARKFSQSHFFDWLRDYRVTVAAGVPTVLQMLLVRPVPFHKRDLPSLRFMTSSSAPLAPETHEAFEAQYGIPIVQGCGMSEAGFMAGNSPSWRKMGSIGRPMRFTTLTFVDGTGRPCGPGEEGEMVVSGWKLAAGYVAPHGGMTPIPHDGFPTGDMGYRDVEEFIFLTGRKKDLIIRGGVNISPMEVTNTLLGHPDVHDAATAGVPDPIYGEEVTSFVVRRSGSTVDAGALVEHCRKRLPDFKVPKVVLFVDAIPKTDRGKVAKAELLKAWERAQPSPRDAGALRAEVRGLKTED